MVDARPQGSRDPLTRVPAGFAADIVVHGKDGTLRGVVDDISEGGMRLRTAQQLEAGADLFVAFTFPGDDHATDVAAEVITWEQPAPGLYIAHCRFVDLPARTLRRIASWVHLPRQARQF